MRRRKIQNKKMKGFLTMLDGIKSFSTCISRQVGAMIINPNNWNVISYGYNGAPSGVTSCKEQGQCFRHFCKSGEGLNTCLATHAEINSIVNAAKMGYARLDGSILICSTQPCLDCLKACVNAGIKEIYYNEAYNIIEPLNQIYKMILDQSDIGIQQIKR